MCVFTQKWFLSVQYLHLRMHKITANCVNRKSNAPETTFFRASRLYSLIRIFICLLWIMFQVDFATVDWQARKKIRHLPGHVKYNICINALQLWKPTHALWRTHTVVRVCVTTKMLTLIMIQRKIVQAHPSHFHCSTKRCKGTHESASECHGLLQIRSELLNISPRHLSIRN